jgi:hypothetical protein
LEIKLKIKQTKFLKENDIEEGRKSGENLRKDISFIS